MNLIKICKLKFVECVQNISSWEKNWESRFEKWEIIFGTFWTNYFRYFQRNKIFSGEDFEIPNQTCWVIYTDLSNPPAHTRSFEKRCRPPSTPTPTPTPLDPQNWSPHQKRGGTPALISPRPSRTSSINYCVRIQLRIQGSRVWS